VCVCVCVCVWRGGGVSKVETVVNNLLECDLNYTILHYSKLLYADSRDRYFGIIIIHWNGTTPSHVMIDNQSK
jgi:hypothetical protein